MHCIKILRQQARASLHAVLDACSGQHYCIVPFGVHPPRVRSYPQHKEPVFPLTSPSLGTAPVQSSISKPYTIESWSIAPLRILGLYRSCEIQRVSGL